MAAASVATQELNAELANARRKGKPVRIYFKCAQGSNEKALWLDAFSVVQRMSKDSRRSIGIRSLLANNVKVIRPHRGRARTRSSSVEEMVPNSVDMEESSMIEFFDSTGEDNMDEISMRVHHLYYGLPMKKKEQKEYKVIPGYAYPHRWMSVRELYGEMMLQSTVFHDLRQADRSGEEIGHLRIEVLQAIGLPRLDMASDTDAVVYLVCGPHAFATDVIPDRTNPMWLRKTRRACIFPLYHGYARVYVGVFDDDGEKAKDDFAGRVVLDVARLRANSQYDVLLPLRMSSQAYARRPRGSIRLRFTLTWKNEKDVMLSYLPKKFKVVPPMRAKPDYSTSIPCADAKAFRNVAFTVHGTDMPGRFKLSKIKAAIREVTFTIRFVRLTIQQELKDIKTWINPSISAFVFCAWMHCILKSSCSLVPGYFGVFVLLQFVRTYALYAVEGPTQAGFVAPTWEEMTEVMIRPRSASSIEPLVMQRQTLDSVRIETHKPLGRFLFQCLGFLPWDDDLKENDKRVSNPNRLHLEFPFASGDVYEKFCVKDCLADIKLNDDNQDDEAAEAKEFDDSSATKNLSSSGSNRPAKRWISSAASSSKQAEDTSEENEDEEKEEVQSVGQSVSTDNDDEPIHDDQPLVTEMNTMFNSVRHGAETLAHALPIRKEQDMNWKSGKSNKDEKLTDTIDGITYKLHALTWHAFNDSVYDIKDPKSTYFGEPIKAEKHQKRKRKKTINRKLNKLLGVREFSHVSAIVSQLGLFVEPFIGVAYGYLSAFRAVFNIGTWQDPYLTFLCTSAIAAVTVVLFLVPWRPVLFGVGIWFVGPQNWVVRKLRERGTLRPLKRKEHKEEVKEYVPPSQQSIFHSHKRQDNSQPTTSSRDVDVHQVQHIVVPYSQFMYQRIYDWPPEKQYSSVIPTAKRQLERELSSLSLTSRSTLANSGRKIHDSASPSSSSVSSASSSRFPRLQRLRRRLRHSQKGDKDDLSKLSEGPESGEEM